MFVKGGEELGEKNLDMTKGPIASSLVRFAIPIFLGQLFQQLYTTADSIIVGKFADKNALAAVASSGHLIFMVTGFFIGLFVGAGVVISRYFGAKDNEKMNRAIHSTVLFSILCGVIMTIFGIFCTPTILVWMDTPESVLPLSITYFRLYFTGSIAMVVYDAGMGVLRAIGDSKSPLHYLIVSSVVNVLLDLLFVAVFHWGVAGAAVATAISQTVSAVLCLIKMMRLPEPYRVHLGKLRFNLPLIKQIAVNGIPSGVQNAIISIANVVVQSNINAFDADAVAGCGAYSKVEGFVFLPITSFAMALTTFISQNLGSKQYDRARQGSKIGMAWSMALAEGIGVLFYYICPAAIGLFNDDPAVIANGVLQMRTECFFFFALALSHSVAAIMRGAGKAKMPMYTMLACWCLIRVSYITVAVRFFPVIQTVFWAYPLTWSLSSVVFLIYYFKADWLHAFDHEADS